MDDGRPSSEHLHLAFPARDRETVVDFHDAATAAGYASNGAPGERAQYHRGYFAAFISDRGDDYFAQFTERYNASLAEQEAGICVFYVLIAEDAPLS